MSPNVSSSINVGAGGDFRTIVGLTIEIAKEQTSTQDQVVNLEIIKGCLETAKLSLPPGGSDQVVVIQYVETIDQTIDAVNNKTPLPSPPPATGAQTTATDPPPASSGATKPPTPGNVASFAIADRQNLAYCNRLSGPADLAVGKALLIGQLQDGQPQPATYYYTKTTINGSGWTGLAYLSKVAINQWFTLYLFVMDASAAETFYNDHLAQDGKSSLGTTPPANGSQVAVMRVKQTSKGPDTC